MDSTGLKTEDGRMEQSFGGTETLVANSDDLAVGKLVRLLKRRRLRGGLNLLVEIECDVTKLLLDVANDLTLGGGVEGITTLGKNLHEVIGEITASHVDTRDGVGKRKSLVDGHHVGDTITGIQDNTCGTTGSVKGEDGLDGDVEGGGVEGFENDLGHLLSVGLGVDGRLGQEHGVLFGGDSELVVESVMPDLLHVVPVCDNTVLDGVLQRQDTTLRLGLISNIGILLTHANHDATITGPSALVFTHTTKLNQARLL